MKKTATTLAATDKEWLKEMTRFYKEVFDLECDFSQLRTPISREGFGWLLVVDERVLAEVVFQKCMEQFTCLKYTDSSLDEIVPTNDRDQKNGTYALWLRDTVEADDVHQNKSADMLKQKGVTGITLCERLILELWHFWKTGEHLDIQNYTLCSGSRCDSGNVPGVDWHPGYRRLNVGWYSTDRRHYFLRCREVVS